MTASEQFADYEIIDTKEKLEGLYQAPLEIAKATCSIAWTSSNKLSYNTHRS